MFITYFGMMPMITPPIAIGAFAAATLSGSDPMQTGYAAMRFGWLAFVISSMFAISPTLLIQGRPFLVVFNFLTALVGTCLVSRVQYDIQSPMVLALKKAPSVISAQFFHQ